MSSDAGTLTAVTAAPERAVWSGRIRSLAPPGRRAAAVALGAMIFISLALVLFAANRPSTLSPVTHEGFFPGWMAGPLGGLLPGATNGATAMRVVFTTSLLALIVCYLLVLRGASSLPTKVVLGSIVLVQLLYMLAPPLATTDIFNYINYARMEAVHNLNPYTTIAASEPHSDPAFLLSNWHQLLDPYGPSFTILTMALVPLGVAGTFWALKVLFTVASLALLALVWRCAKLLGRDPVFAVAFVGLNPIVIIWGLGGGHNDFFMMLAVFGALYLVLREQRVRAPSTAALWPVSPRYAGAGFALVAACSLKASAAVVIPVALAYAWRERRAFVQLLVGMALGAIVFGSATLAAFGPHLPNISAQSSLVTPESIPNLVGLGLGFGGETAGLRLLSDVLLVGSVAWGAWWAYTRRDLLVPVGWVSVALLLTLSWVLPWYVIWVLPMAAVAASRRLRLAALLVGLYLIISPVSVWRALGVYPESTPLGHQHQREVDELLH
ncbi:MAG TPA: hypothetical protein VMA83_03285 [Solirubrobacteraceae bacterium]|nr:hypothetical protein [Solirubrobacteraceae bacterium]